ncbi:hypothetical protein [Bacillus sp. NTK034]|uniref:hypothetical protein n=1 Tax=Bacillus sp. NTK034 TaxID=2802176 RepID=UPI001A8CEB94|nr:hypothetical protein [Bacillus sp. NTK034]MBN8203489.1 hypothetical protein [Bacillus sp. NTK034]
MVLEFREILYEPETPITFKNGVWTIKKRVELWKSLGSRVFDDNLESFKNWAISVLTILI